jgi:hypothetical protein
MRPSSIGQQRNKTEEARTPFYLTIVAIEGSNTTFHLGKVILLNLA